MRPIAGLVRCWPGGTTPRIPPLGWPGGTTPRILPLRWPGRTTALSPLLPVRPAGWPYCVPVAADDRLADGARHLSPDGREHRLAATDVRPHPDG